MRFKKRAELFLKIFKNGYIVVKSKNDKSILVNILDGIGLIYDLSLVQVWPVYLPDRYKFTLLPNEKLINKYYNQLLIGKKVNIINKNIFDQLSLKCFISGVEINTDRKHDVLTNQSAWTIEAARDSEGNIIFKGGDEMKLRNELCNKILDNGYLFLSFDHELRYVTEELKINKFEYTVITLEGQMAELHKYLMTLKYCDAIVAYYYKRLKQDGEIMLIDIPIANTIKLLLQEERIKYIISEDSSRDYWEKPIEIRLLSTLEKANTESTMTVIDLKGRPSKDEYYLGIAKAVLERSTCLRRQYGAVIVKNDEIISTGYNGSARGEVNCLEKGTCPRIEMNIPQGERYEECVAIHAEQNAIISAARKDMVGATLYLYGREYVADHKAYKTIEAKPCKICARLIKNAGIVKVVTPLDK